MHHMAKTVRTEITDPEGKKTVVTTTKKRPLGFIGVVAILILLGACLANPWLIIPTVIFVALGLWAKASANANRHR